jgi:hypothetical protein
MVLEKLSIHVQKGKNINFATYKYLKMNHRSKSKSIKFQRKTPHKLWLDKNS